MIKTYFGAALAMALLGAGVCQAQTVSTIDITTSAANPTTDALFGNAQPCSISTNVVHNINSVQITVGASGTYNVADESPTDDGGYAIYSGAFNPANLTQNCVASLDTNASWTLASGTYTLVGGPWTNQANGVYRVAFNGPGTVVVAAPAAPVPTMSEWAMILLCMILAGSAALYIQRRQLKA